MVAASYLVSMLLNVVFFLPCEGKTLDSPFSVFPSECKDGQVLQWEKTSEARGFAEWINNARPGGSRSLDKAPCSTHCTAAPLQGANRV